MNKEINYCLNKCKGLEKNCEKYSDVEDIGFCDWYSMLNNEIPKHNNHNTSQLENNINKLILDNYNKNSAFIFDTKKKALYKAGKILALYNELPKQWKQFNNVYEI